jgi:HPt (histidine-containing phosphotransfer) domain-containing protein
MQLPVFDVDAVLARVEDDRELLAELLALFFDEYPKLLEGISQAVQQRQAVQMERLAHSLKSALLNLSAPRAADAARQAELLGHAADFQGAAAALNHLRKELDQLRHAMEQFLRTSAT